MAPPNGATSNPGADPMVKEIAVSSAEPVWSNTNQPTVRRVIQLANPLTTMPDQSCR